MIRLAGRLAIGLKELTVAACGFDGAAPVHRIYLQLNFYRFGVL
jgi:hypothetical protein